MSDYEEMILKDLFDVWNQAPVGQAMEPLNAEHFVAELVARNTFHLVGAAVKSRNRAEHWAKATLAADTREETTSENIARDIREGRFPSSSPKQMRPA